MKAILLKWFSEVDKPILLLPLPLHQYVEALSDYTDVDKKLERVVRQLQAECDSNLQKETYRIALLRQRSKPKLRKKLKA